MNLVSFRAFLPEMAVFYISQIALLSRPAFLSFLMDKAYHGILHKAHPHWQEKVTNGQYQR